MTDKPDTGGKPKRGRKPKAEGQVEAASKTKKPGTSKSKPLPDTLRIELDAPGMNPSFRAGAGGLAAALYFIAKERGVEPPWIEPLPLGSGRATVGERHIELEFGGDPEATLEALFKATFRLSPDGLIELAGTFEPGSPPSTHLASELQNALTLSVLQHNQHRALETETPQHRVTILDGGREVSYSFVRCSEYVHQRAAKLVLKAFTKPQALAGWAYLGAGERHFGLTGTKWQFDADQALSAIYTAIGGLALKASNSQGVLLLSEPRDLRSFARHRPKMTPRHHADVTVASAGDAALRLRLELRMAREAGVAAIDGVHVATTAILPWATQIKSRRQMLEFGTVPEEALILYEVLAGRLPPTVQATKQANKDTGKPSAFTSVSPLRALVSDNLARGNHWFRGFATATSSTTSKPQPLVSSIYRAEKEALMALNEHLDDAEAALVRAVHLAIRQRFGAIAAESGNTPARSKRQKDESDKWRFAFSGAKTHSQIRAALAALWSRAGSNRELQEHWPLVLPLLREANWQTARDLALVALASYRGKGPEAVLDADIEPEAPSEDFT